MKIKKRY